MPTTIAGRWSLKFSQSIRREKDLDELVKEAAASAEEHRTGVLMAIGRTADCFIFSDGSRLAFSKDGHNDAPPKAWTYQNKVPKNKVPKAASTAVDPSTNQQTPAETADLLINDWLIDNKTVEEMFSCDSDCGVSRDNGGPLYECGACSNKFNKEDSRNGANLCECGKFGAKTGSLSCENCNEASVTAVKGFECSDCDETHTLLSEELNYSQMENIGYCPEVLQEMVDSGLLTSNAGT